MKNGIKPCAKKHFLSCIVWIALLLRSKALGGLCMTQNRTSTLFCKCEITLCATIFIFFRSVEMKHCTRKQDHTKTTQTRKLNQWQPQIFFFAQLILVVSTRKCLWAIRLTVRPIYVASRQFRQVYSRLQFPKGLMKFDKSHDTWTNWITRLENYKRSTFHIMRQRLTDDSCIAFWQERKRNLRKDIWKREKDCKEIIRQTMAID